MGSHFAILASLLLTAVFTSAGETVHTVEALRQAKTDGKLGTGFDLQAVVTYNARTRGEHLTLQDESAAISAWYHADLDPNAISPGDLVRATGRINRGRRPGLAIDCTGLEILEHGHLPAPLPVTAEDLSQNDFGNRLVRLEGTVVDAVPDDLDAEWAYVVLKCGRVNAYVATRTHGLRLQPEKLIGARVSATGVRHGGGGQRRMIDATLYLDSLDSLTMLERTPSEDPFLAPDVGDLCFFGRNACPAGERRSATGTVLAIWDDNNVLLRTDAGQLAKGELVRTTLPGFGERIRLVGFPETDLYTVILVRADWRSESGTAQAPEVPMDITPLQLQTRRPNGTQQFDATVQGRVVRLRGRVRGLPVCRTDNRLYLECDGQMVTVDACACPEALADLTADCTVEIRGTCVMETERMSQNLAFPRIRGFLIALRTPDDVRILARPPWWTPTRLLVAICGLLLALAAIFVWNVLLRRLAERRGRELMSEQLARVESDLKVSERTRLSVELHDTLSQNLIGASMEINTAEQLVTDNEALRHLGIASKTLKSSRDELRNCLWDLRSEALEEADMNEAIRKTLAPYIEDIDLQVRFNVPRKLFTDNTAHALMRIIRELVLNAIRQGHAKSIRIAGSRENGCLLFSVKDDGCGFDPDAAPGIAQGHFGLQGVRERLRHLKGRLEISSSATRGTKVTASMELPEIDGVSNCKMKKIKVLIADDHAIVRMGLSSILGTKKDIEVVGDAEDGATAVRKAQKFTPDVVLMDIVMPEMDGATATAEILKSCPSTKVLILTSFGTADGIAHALEAGAAGALIKNIDYSELVEAIRTVASGKSVVSPEITKMLRESPPVPELTERQLEILESVTRGLTDAEIGRQLQLTPNGVREHITKIFQKIGAANRAEAVAIALKKHLLKI